MKDVALLVGLFVVLLVALVATRQDNHQPREQREEWEIIKSTKVDQMGDTIVVLQTMIRHAE